MGAHEKPNHFDDNRGLNYVHDSSWGIRPRPMGGFGIMCCNGLLAWSAKSLKIVPDSTCEAETAVASRATKEGLDIAWVRVCQALEDISWAASPTDLVYARSSTLADPCSLTLWVLHVQIACPKMVSKIG